MLPTLNDACSFHRLSQVDDKPKETREDKEADIRMQTKVRARQP